MPRAPFDPRAARAAGQPPAAPQAGSRGQFRSLNASLLFCPHCREATPARERLLLILPSGNKYEYLCSRCGASTGEKTDQVQHDTALILP